MPLETALISLDNPVFHTYALAATIMILKLRRRRSTRIRSKGNWRPMSTSSVHGE
jgi:hypothetical protein